MTLVYHKIMCMVRHSKLMGMERKCVTIFSLFPKENEQQFEMSCK